MMKPEPSLEERQEPEASQSARAESAIGEFQPKSRSWECLSAEIARCFEEQLVFGYHDVNLPTSVGPSWELFEETGNMKFYCSPQTINGIVCDPLKAVAILPGVTAHEVCQVFFAPEYRFGWNSNLLKMDIVEMVNPETIVFHETFKTPITVAQRDAVFWSHLRQIAHHQLPLKATTRRPHSIWMVVNKSTPRPDIRTGDSVRLEMLVSMICETYIEGVDNRQAVDATKLSRKQLSCKVIYSSQSNPGGWLPDFVVRSIFKREYPRFMKRFTNYCVEHFEGKPIML